MGAERAAALGATDPHGAQPDVASSSTHAAPPTDVVAPGVDAVDPAIAPVSPTRRVANATGDRKEG